MGFNPFSAEFIANPYPHYEHLRQGPAAQREEQPNGMVTWIVPSYEHARQVLTDSRFSSNLAKADQENLRRGGLLGLSGGVHIGQAMIVSDPPVHTRLRSLVNRTFTPARVAALRPRVQAIADRLLEAVAPRGHTDLIADLADPLPVRVICELLGIAPDAHDDFRGWISALFITPTSEAARAEKELGARTLADRLLDLVIERRPYVNLGVAEANQPDLLSALIRTSDGERRLNERELVGMMMQIVVAGYETTRNLIGNGMLALLRHPDQLDLLRGRPGLLPSAIDELLRYDSPVPRPSYRVALENVEIGGVPIPAGSLVSVLIGAANRDSGRFSNADRLDITRRDHQHLAFGHGIHYCLGAPLARLEGEIAIGTMLRRFPDLKPTPGAEIRWRPGSIFLRGLETLPVELSRRPLTGPRHISNRAKENGPRGRGF